MREIVFDTETTGMDPTEGHRLVEIGCIELVNHVPTGRTYHQYINPEREVDPEAVAVHGLDNARLENEPTFGEVIGDFIDFVGTDSKLVAHNAAFDMKFVNYQVKEFGFPTYDPRRVIDTLAIARKKFPGSPASLDALCRRFGIDNSDRVLHGALLDAELLAEVYLELLGGRQQGLAIEDEKKSESVSVKTNIDRKFREPRDFKVSEQELAAHQKMREELKDSLWK
ncbi:MAG: DNA polymerase III subunit epsilon [Pseudomonadota bacterium]